MRVFVAVDIEDDKIWDEVEKIQRYLVNEGVKGTFPAKNQLHITIKFLGNISDEMVGNISEQLNEITHPPFKIRLDGVTGFPSFRSPRVVVIKIFENQSLKSLFKKVEEKMYGIGFRKESRAFSPHFTIARVKKPWSWKRYIAGKLSEISLDYDYLVYSFKLKSSILTPNGPIYKDLYEYKLETVDV